MGADVTMDEVLCFIIAVVVVGKVGVVADDVVGSAVVVAGRVVVVRRLDCVVGPQSPQYNGQ